MILTRPPTGVSQALIFFLPLPLEKTMATLDKVGHPELEDGQQFLPDPELYIMVNGHPTNGINRHRIVSESAMKSGSA